MDSASNKSTRTVGVSHAATSGARLAASAGALVALTKPKIAFASLVSAVAGFVAAGGASGFLENLLVIFAIALSAGGSLAFNQWWERDTDPHMARTRNRPLPRRTLPPTAALVWSILLSVAGVALLIWCSLPAAAALAAATILVYALIYTPLKRRTRWATEIGAISGALPPVLGAAAAGDPWSSAAWVLAVILLFWQMPHFFSIGWIHRADYRAAGLPLLPAIDPDGRHTALVSLAYAAPLLLALVLPWPLGWFGPIYGIPATVSGLLIVVRAIRFLKAPGDRNFEARRLFLSTVQTLPLIMLGLVIDARFP